MNTVHTLVSHSWTLIAANRYRPDYARLFIQWNLYQLNGANVGWKGCRFGQDSNGDVIIAEVWRCWLNCTWVWTTCTWRIARSIRTWPPYMLQLRKWFHGCWQYHFFTLFLELDPLMLGSYKFNFVKLSPAHSSHTATRIAGVFGHPRTSFTRSLILKLGGNMAPEMPQAAAIL